MRREPDERVRRKPRRWRRMGMLAAAGMLSLAGCSSLDSNSTAQAPDPFLGPAAPPAPKATAVAAVQPPPGAIAPAVTGVLPAAAAPNPTVSVAALAPSSVHPLGDRSDLHIGSPRTGNGPGWSPTAAGPAVANAGGKATLATPEAAAPPTRTPAPTMLTQNTAPQPAAQQVSWPPPPVQSSSTGGNPTPASPQPAQPAANNAAAQPQTAPSRQANPLPTSVEEATALLANKHANWQPATQNAQTGDWTFRCVVLNAKANKLRTYEGHGPDQLSAMNAVLDEINQDQ